MKLLYIKRLRIFINTLFKDQLWLHVPKMWLRSELLPFANDYECMLIWSIKGTPSLLTTWDAITEHFNSTQLKIAKHCIQKCFSKARLNILRIILVCSQQKRCCVNCDSINCAELATFEVLYFHLNSNCTEKSSMNTLQNIFLWFHWRKLADIFL